MSVILDDEHGAGHRWFEEAHSDGVFAGVDGNRRQKPRPTPIVNLWDA